MMQVDKLSINLFGDAKPVGNGLLELRIHFGPGYRVYFAKAQRQTILLLCAGDKANQDRDIKLAKKYWQGYKQRRDHGTQR